MALYTLGILWGHRALEKDARRTPYATLDSREQVFALLYVTLFMGLKRSIRSSVGPSAVRTHPIPSVFPLLSRPLCLLTPSEAFSICLYALCKCGTKTGSSMLLEACSFSHLESSGIIHFHDLETLVLLMQPNIAFAFFFFLTHADPCTACDQL